MSLQYLPKLKQQKRSTTQQKVLCTTQLIQLQFGKMKLLGMDGDDSAALQELEVRSCWKRPSLIPQWGTVQVLCLDGMS